VVDQEELQEEGKGVKNEESEVLEKDKKVRGPNCVLYCGGVRELTHGRLTRAFV
jgi:hypothetical protein